MLIKGWLMAALILLAAEPDRSNCEPAYPDICIDLAFYQEGTDLSCEDVGHVNFVVTWEDKKNPEYPYNDPHGFDRDKDGLGCED